MYKHDFKIPGRHDEQARKASFTAWLAANEITTAGIHYQRIPGKGLGVVAQRRLEAGEELVQVPLSALLTVNNIPESFRQKHKALTVHALLALFLATGADVDQKYAVWISTWPTLSDFRESMPLCWPQQGMTASPEGMLDRMDSKHMAVLPPAIERLNTQLTGSASEPSSTCGLLQSQRSKFRTDWEVVSRIHRNMAYERYLYFWLIVNTRSFYYDISDIKKRSLRDDCMALCPFIDLFNHNDSGCAVRFGSTGFTVMSDKVYEIGDEVFVSYGRHSNDFLLVEYGFILDNNRWDSTSVDHLLMNHLHNTAVEEQLRKAGYLGDYTLSHEGLCFRTEVAIRSRILTNSSWERFVQGLEIAEEVVKNSKTADLIRSYILDPFYHEADVHIRSLHGLIELPLGARQVLIKRWKQIQALLQLAEGSL